MQTCVTLALLSLDDGTTLRVLGGVSGRLAAPDDSDPMTSCGCPRGQRYQSSPRDNVARMGEPPTTPKTRREPCQPPHGRNAPGDAPQHAQVNQHDNEGNNGFRDVTNRQTLSLTATATATATATIPQRLRSSIREMTTSAQPSSAALERKQRSARTCTVRLPAGEGPR